jgi:hypothetical protein
MPVISKFTRDLILPYGNENAVASFYKWLRDLFDHESGYTVVLDKELTSPETRQQLPYPCLVVNQIDTTDNGRGYFAGEMDENTVLFYVYCMVNKSNREFGTTRLLRRMKDQVVFAVKQAGRFSEQHNDVVIPPIALYNFGQKPPVDLDSTLVLSTNVMQHFSEDGEILEYELMLNFTYKEHLNV